MKRVTAWYSKNKDGAWEFNHIVDGWALDLDRPHSNLPSNHPCYSAQESGWANKKWKAVYAFMTSDVLVSEKAACIAAIKMSNTYNYIPNDELVKKLESKI